MATVTTKAMLHVFVAHDPAKAKQYVRQLAPDAIEVDVAKERSPAEKAALRETMMYAPSGTNATYLVTNAASMTAAGWRALGAIAADPPRDVQFYVVLDETDVIPAQAVHALTFATTETLDETFDPNAHFIDPNQLSLVDLAVPLNAEPT